MPDATSMTGTQMGQISAAGSVMGDKEESSLFEAPLIDEAANAMVESAPPPLTAAEIAAEKQKKKQGLGEYIWMRAQETGVVKTCVWIFLTMMYQVIGAWIYLAIEGSHDEKIRLEDYHNSVERMRNRTIWMEQFIEGVQNVRPEDPAANEKYEELIDGYSTALGLNMTAIPMKDTEGWSWMNSIFFCFSLQTSIGFGGRLYPQTNTGMVITMVYSFITVPFFLSMTGDLGLVVFEGIYVFWWRYMVWWRSREEPEFDEDQLRGFKTTEYNELYKKELATFPVSFGVFLSLLSLLIGTLGSMAIEDTWDFFDANYYMVTSFLLIGLGDISPSAPDGLDRSGNKVPEITLLYHILLLIFNLTFIGLSQHVMSRRIELAYVRIGYAMHMEFRTRQVEPDISTMKSEQSPIAEETQIGLIARKLGSSESFFYGSMDRSRRKYLHETWHKKANMKCVDIQTNLPKRDVGCQHLMNVDEDTDMFVFGDDLGEEPPPPKKIVAPDLRPYVYKVMD